MWRLAYLLFSNKDVYRCVQNECSIRLLVWQDWEIDRHKDWSKIGNQRVGYHVCRQGPPPVKPNSPYRIQHPFPWLIGEIWKINHSEIGIRSLNWDNVKLIHSWILFNFHFILFTHYFTQIKTDNCTKISTNIL